MSSPYAHLDPLTADPDQPDGLWQQANEPTAIEDEAAPFVILSRSDLRSRPKPQWLIEGLLQGSGVVMLGGTPGVGKSFLAIDFAAHIATGRKWQGRPTKPGRVLYVAAEGIEFFEDRLNAWEVQNRVLIPDEGLEYVEEGFSLSDQRAVDHMRAAVAAKPYDLIVLDTLSQLSDLTSENDNAELAKILRAAKAVRMANPGATVLVIHHLSKGEKGVLRGASAIRANADSVIIAKPKGGGFMLSTRLEDDGKMKNAAPEEIQGFRLRECEQSSVVVRDRGEDKDGEAVADVLRDGEPHGISEFLSARGDMGEATSQRLRRRLRFLEDAGTVVAEGSSRARTWRLAVGA